MARTNKYASFNFNDIYDKKFTTTTTNNHHRSTSSSSTNPSINKTALSNSRIHGNMLVLSRPSPKPIAPPHQPSPPLPTTQPPDQTPIKADSISLRPLGLTGSGRLLSSSIFPPGRVKDSPVSPKTNKFVPPHLRPGFHGKEEKPESQIHNQTLKSPIYFGEEGRPKSGVGYERVNISATNRPRSSGSTRPYSSG